MPAPKKATAKKKPAAKKKPDSTCFVLMPFKGRVHKLYDAIILPAVRAANLQALRGDSLFRPTHVMADVWQMIQEAEVLVAVLTGRNVNVFYELGLAHAIGRPIVLISETIDDVPFDLQGLRVILYDDKEEFDWGKQLERKITATLKEVMANPAAAVLPMFQKAVTSQSGKAVRFGRAHATII